jgi:Fic-DOC domain mobile mystery protein B
MDPFEEPPDATPLAPVERDGLKQYWITTRNDLNIAEQDNIGKGMNWARRQRAPTPSAMLREAFALQLHKRMFGDVWNWAGAYRSTERNIGIAAFQIPTATNHVFGDVKYWIANNSFGSDEIAIRLHHRLVAIHPFPNGNGRHSRFMADLLCERLGAQPFKWSGGNLTNTGELRTAYVSALRSADNHDIEPLLNFART